MEKLLIIANSYWILPNSELCAEYIEAEITDLEPGSEGTKVDFTFY